MENLLTLILEILGLSSSVSDDKKRHKEKKPKKEKGIEKKKGISKTWISIIIIIVAILYIYLRHKRWGDI